MKVLITLFYMLNVKHKTKILTHNSMMGRFDSLATLWTITRQTPLSMESPRRKKEKNEVGCHLLLLRRNLNLSLLLTDQVPSQFTNSTICNKVYVNIFIT